MTYLRRCSLTRKRMTNNTWPTSHLKNYVKISVSFYVPGWLRVFSKKGHSHIPGPACRFSLSSRVYFPSSWSGGDHCEHLPKRIEYGGGNAADFQRKITGVLSGSPSWDIQSWNPRMILWGSSRYKRKSHVSFTAPHQAQLTDTSPPELWASKPWAFMWFWALFSNRPTWSLNEGGTSYFHCSLPE